MWGILGKTGLQADKAGLFFCTVIPVLSGP